MIRAYVADDMAGYGVRIAIVSQGDNDTTPREVLRIVGKEDGVHHFHWQLIEPGTHVEPTLQLPGDMARAVLDGLSRHFQGTDDARALRRDYEHERGRSDKLTDALIGIARGLVIPGAVTVTAESPIRQLVADLTAPS